MKVFQALTKTVTSGIWMDSGEEIIITEPENSMRLLKLDGEVLHSWNDKTFIDIAKSPNSNILAYSSTNHVGIINLETKEHVKELSIKGKI